MLDYLVLRNSTQATFDKSGRIKLWNFQNGIQRRWLKVDVPKYKSEPDLKIKKIEKLDFAIINGRWDLKKQQF